MRALLLPLMSCHKFSRVQACTMPCHYLYSLCADYQALVAYSKHIVLKVRHCHRFPNAWHTAWSQVSAPPCGSPAAYAASQRARPRAAL